MKIYKIPVENIKTVDDCILVIRLLCAEQSRQANTINVTEKALEEIPELKRLFSHTTNKKFLKGDI